MGGGNVKIRNEERGTRNEKRETRNEKRETRIENRESRIENREMRIEKCIERSKENYEGVTLLLLQYR